MQPDSAARPEYVAAFREIAARIATTLATLPKQVLPIKMYVAGGAALHLYTGARISQDIDAVFSHRVALPENLKVPYNNADGKACTLYFDRQYNETFGLLHEDAHDDSVLLALDGIDSNVLEVRLLSALDLAVSKVGRLAEHDRADIEALALRGLFNAQQFRERAEAAALGFVGDLTRLHHSIQIATRIVADAAARASQSGPKRPF
jgi:Nucleotidyltransferase of unknown function (DUF6036)